MPIDIDEAIQKMLTCASDLHCRKEAACFEVAKWARDVRAQQRIDKATDVDCPDLDEVKDYAPGWEMP